MTASLSSHMLLHHVSSLGNKGHLCNDRLLKQIHDRFSKTAQIENRVLLENVLMDSVDAASAYWQLNQNAKDMH